MAVQTRIVLSSRKASGDLAIMHNGTSLSHVSLAWHKTPTLGCISWLADCFFCCSYNQKSYLVGLIRRRVVGIRGSAGKEPVSMLWSVEIWIVPWHELMLVS